MRASPRLKYTVRIALTFEELHRRKPPTASAAHIKHTRCRGVIKKFVGPDWPGCRKNEVKPAASRRKL
jgi:hypothetical protein